MNTIETRELNDTELEIAAGGKISCDTAWILFSIYKLAADALRAGGAPDIARRFDGKADGSFEAC